MSKIKAVSMTKLNVTLFKRIEPKFIGIGHQVANIVVKYTHTIFIYSCFGKVPNANYVHLVTRINYHSTN